MPYTQIRIARPTSSLKEIQRFYCDGLGLNKIGGFRDHDGYNGVMIGLPDESYHLEFTEHTSGASFPPPTKDNLLIFYFADLLERNILAEKLFAMGFPETEPENPYWKKDGITIEDPDTWRIVLMGIKDFRL